MSHMENSNPQASADSLTRAESLLKSNRIGPAAELLENLHAEQPDHPRGLFLLAVCRRVAKRYDEALELLARLTRLEPEYGRAWQEIGHNHRDRGKVVAAVEAYRKAVDLNPGLLASWRDLARMLQQNGDSAAAGVADANARRLAGLPRELQSVTSMMHEDRLYKAEKLCRHYLQQHPHHLEGMRLLAAIGSRLNILDDAEFLLESALELEPSFDLARVDYIKVLHKRQKFAKAFEQATELRRRMPGNVAAEMAYANQCSAVGRYDEALEVLDALLDTSPNPANVDMLRGHAFKTIGRPDDALAAYRSAASRRPDFGDAWWSLANMKTYRFADAEVERMQQLEASGGLARADHYHLCFALGKAHEDREEFKHSFRYYARGNRLKKEELGYSAERMQQDFDRQKTFFTVEQVETLAHSAVEEADPIFIVGLPRAGSTLVEQILASHSLVDGTLELPNILSMAHRLNGRLRIDEAPRYPGVLAELERERLSELGRQFLEETRIHRDSAPFFTDKMPNNFRHIGLIKTILPNARIIDARRSAMACCFSGFKQLFAEGQEFSYGLEDIGRYYAGYVDLMDHWQSIYPDSILQVSYEDVVADLEAEVQRMLDFLGLEFESACIEFHRTKRSVRTASSEQVRKPIYTSGLEQWRHFEPWLDELKQVLGPALTPE
jgi:tetratricopeptide (TPR) repeat protein